MTGEHVAPAVPVQRTEQDQRFGSPDAAPVLDRLADLARRLLGTADAEVRVLAAAPPTQAPDDRADASCDDLCALVPGDAPLVVSTGKAEDRRNPTYFTELLAHAAALGVGDNFRVLGLVPYDHLSVLSREAVALINPSHFEGWSTTVEEAKSMGKAIILSDIPVHREQAPERGVYVPTDAPAAMAAAMRSVRAGWSRGTDEAAMAAATAALPARRRAFGETYQRIVLEAVARDA